MRQIVTRADFRHLSIERLQEAEALLAIGKWGGAYYLAGYAVELALKACIINLRMATYAFPEKSFSQNCYTHDLGQLVGLSGLGDAHKAAMEADPDLKTHWMTVRDWLESTRYCRIEEVEARDFHRAITDDEHGVLSWIRNYWQTS